jgi:hypothetical protein
MLFLHFAGTGEQLLQRKHTWTCGQDSRKRFVTVGAFGRSGLFVSAHPAGYASRGLGICPAQPVSTTRESPIKPKMTTTVARLMRLSSSQSGSVTRNAAIATPSTHRVTTTSGSRFSSRGTGRTSRAACHVETWSAPTRPPVGNRGFVFADKRDVAQVRSPEDIGDPARHGRVVERLHPQLYGEGPRDERKMRERGGEADAAQGGPT